MATAQKGLKETLVIGAAQQDEECESLAMKAYTVNGKKFCVPMRYHLRKSVGYGAYGIVCAATDPVERCKVAIKKCQKVFKDVGDCKRVLREVKLLRFLQHENILGIKHFYVGGRADTFQDVYLVSELLDTDLNTVIRSKQQLSDDHVKYFVYQILRGLKYIHTANVMHRDLKPANLLVNISCDLRICDFGLARGYDVGQSMLELTDYVITRWYRPPELLLMSKHYTCAIDLWSVGCIFAEIVLRRTLFPGKDYLTQLQMICDAIGAPTAESLDFLESPEAVHYVLSLERKTPKTMAELVPGLDEVGQDFLRQMLAFNPKDRRSAGEMMAHPYLASLHDPSDEPGCPSHFEWEYDAVELSREQLRALFLEEAASFPALQDAPIASAAALPPQQEGGRTEAVETAPVADRSES